MRFALAIAALLLAASSVQAERRIFIIANNGDGYGVDRCLANGVPCGAAAAAAYCKSKDFQQAVSFQKVDKDEITGAIPDHHIADLPGRDLRSVRRHRLLALSRNRLSERAAKFRRRLIVFPSNC